MAGFEGTEKRLELEFELDAEARAPSNGLRGLSEADWSTILRPAHCGIVANISNASFDSYLLTESSMFIYPLKVVIKTCGRTRLLKAIPALLCHAAERSLNVKGCRYSRGNFIFPAAQPLPHGSFTEEVEFLNDHFPMLTSRASCVMGNDSRNSNMRWHVYSAVEEESLVLAPNYTVEVCMRDLDRGVAAHFFGQTADEMRVASGIDTLMTHNSCELYDLALTPCGYSINGMETDGAGYWTIHVTPEDGYSFASFEMMDVELSTPAIEQLLQRVSAVFAPANLSISLYTTAPSRIESFASLSPCPDGYRCVSSTRHQLPAAGLEVFHIFTKEMGTEEGAEAEASDAVSVAGDASAM